MTQQTPTFPEFKWQVTEAGIEIYNGEDHLFCIPAHEFPVLLLNMVKILKETTKTID